MAAGSADDDRHVHPDDDDRRQLRPRLGPLRVRLQPLPAASTRRRARSSVWTFLGLFVGAAWIEILGLAVVGATRRPKRTPVHQIYALLGGGRRRRDRDDRDLLRHGRRQRHERLHGLAVAAGGGPQGLAAARPAVVAVLSFLATLYLYYKQLLVDLRELPAVITYWIGPWAASSSLDWRLAQAIGVDADRGRRLRAAADGLNALDRAGRRASSCRSRS